VNILAIETSTDWCGVALIQGEKCVHKVEKQIPRKHAEKLPMFYNHLRDKTQLDKINLDGIAVSIGPGSFTGLRVGLGFTKGLAFAKSLPIIPVPTLRVMAANTGLGEDEFTIMMYSHRDVVYHQQFSESRPISEEKADTWDSIDRVGVAFQYGCEKLMKSENYVSVHPTAKMTGLLAEKHYKEWVLENPYDLVPNYISPFVLGAKK